MITNLISFSCPLILASFGALFSEYAGCLALFLEGLISFSAFIFFAVASSSGSVFLATFLSLGISTLLVFIFSVLSEKFPTNKFIFAIALNLFFSAMTSALSFLIFNSRGVLTSANFSFSPLYAKTFTLIFSGLLIALALIFLTKSRWGLYLRITGSDADVLKAKGVNPQMGRILAWTLAACYSSAAGIFLTMRISSFVPNIASGRGWMALAAVFLGKKKPIRLLICVLIFCCADIFSANIQNFLPQIPSSALISFPYIIVLALIIFDVF